MKKIWNAVQAFATPGSARVPSSGSKPSMATLANFAVCTIYLRDFKECVIFIDDMEAMCGLKLVQGGRWWMLAFQLSTNHEADHILHSSVFSSPFSHHPKRVGVTNSPISWIAAKIFGSQTLALPPLATIAASFPTQLHSTVNGSPCSNIANI